jgi:flagellar assembly protein FliH
MSEVAMQAASSAWQPPAMSGPLVSFRGKRPDAAEVEHEAHKATREGFEQGRRDGLAAAEEDIKQLRRRLQQQIATVERILQEMAQPFARLDALATRELAQMALSIGSELAATQLRVDPDQLLGIVEEAVTSLPSAGREVRLLLNPHDAHALSSESQSRAHSAGWTIVADAQVGRGGCRVLLDRSEIDAEFSTRVAALCQRLFEDAVEPSQGDITGDLAAERGET